MPYPLGVPGSTCSPWLGSHRRPISHKVTVLENGSRVPDEHPIIHEHFDHQDTTGKNNTIQPASSFGGVHELAEPGILVTSTLTGGSSHACVPRETPQVDGIRNNSRWQDDAHGIWSSNSPVAVEDDMDPITANYIRIHGN